MSVLPQNLCLDQLAKEANKFYILMPRQQETATVENLSKEDENIKVVAWNGSRAKEGRD